MSIIEFNKLIETDNISYNDIDYFQQNGDQDVTDLLWKAWNAIGTNITKILYEDGDEIDLITRSNIPTSIGDYYLFCTELTNRVNMYYLHKLEVLCFNNTTDIQCWFILNKGDSRIKCECGKDINQKINKIQEIWARTVAVCPTKSKALL